MKKYRAFTILTAFLMLMLFSGCDKQVETIEQAQESTEAIEESANESAATTSEQTPSVTPEISQIDYNASDLLLKEYNYYYDAGIPESNDSNYTVVLGGYNKHIISYESKSDKEQLVDELKQFVSLNEDEEKRLSEDIRSNGNGACECTLIKNRDSGYLEVWQHEYGFTINIHVIGENDFSRYESFFTDKLDLGLFGDNEMIEKLLSNMILEKSIGTNGNANLEISYLIALKDDYKIYADYYQSQDFLNAISEIAANKVDIDIDDNTGRIFMYYQIDNISSQIVLFPNCNFIEISQSINDTSSDSDSNEHNQDDEKPIDGEVSSDISVLLNIGFSYYDESGFCDYKVNEEGKEIYIGIYKKNWGSDENRIHMNFKDEKHFNYYIDEGKYEILFFYENKEFSIIYDENYKYSPDEGWTLEDLDYTTKEVAGQTIDVFAKENIEFFKQYFVNTFGKTPVELFD